MNNVVVTGMGVVSPIGIGTSPFWEALTDGQSGIRPRQWSDGSIGVTAEVPSSFSVDDQIDPQRSRAMDRLTQWLLRAAIEAVGESRIRNLPEKRTAVVVGSTMGSLPTLLETADRFSEDGKRAVSSRLMAQIIPNMPAAHIALQWALHGPLLTISTACASSLDAIGQAARMIARDEVDYAIAGGVESLLSPVVYQSLLRARALSRSTDPSLSSRPFDRDRDGFVMGEGAGIVVLERREIAEQRQAPIKASVRGYGSLADGFHVTSPDPTGQYEAMAMDDALEDAALSDPLAAVYAHGTSTMVGDAAEIAGLQRVFKEHVADPIVTSIKGHMGHSMAAAGVMSVIAAIKGMEIGFVPATVGTKNLDPKIDFRVAIGAGIRGTLGNAMVNAFGFGGQNASLVLSRF